MACWVGIESRRDWWSTATPLLDKGAPFQLNHIMSRNRFNYIPSALSFTNIEVPYEDGFFHMLQLEEAWNHNMAQQLFPSRTNVPDESMMEWLKIGILDLCVSAVSRIPLEMSFVVLSPPFYGEHISWRTRTGQLNSFRRNGKIWGRLLGSCYECVSQYF